jgi:hypothetical protein
MPVQTPLDLTGAEVIDVAAARDVDRTVDLRVSADDLLEAFPHPED